MFPLNNHCLVLSAPKPKVDFKVNYQLKQHVLQSMNVLPNGAEVVRIIAAKSISARLFCCDLTGEKK